jgi:hypothetical protein
MLPLKSAMASAIVKPRSLTKKSAFKIRYRLDVALRRARQTSFSGISHETFPSGELRIS